MRIAVCIKEIQNPELASSSFRVDEARKAVIPLDGLLVISPFDEQAIEAALRIRDRLGAAQITLFTLGPKSSQGAIKRGLSMGADAGIVIADSEFGPLDAFGTATILAHAIRRTGEFDLILTGRQAADWDAGIVGCGIGELLGLPVITFARDVRIADGKVVVDRMLDDGWETVETPPPCLITVANELGEPRKATLRETMRASKKPITQLDAALLGLSPESLGSPALRLVRNRLFIPKKESTCEMFAGESAREVAQRLVQRLTAAQLI